TVMIGFIGLFLFDVPTLASLGLGGMVVVGVSLLAALSLLPAILSILGKRINVLRVPLLWRITGIGQASTASRGRSRGATTPEGQGFWSRWALGVMRRPIVII